MDGFTLANGYNARSRGALEVTRRERTMAVTSTERMTEAEYRRFALGDTAGQWELVRGRLREKPGMSVRHGVVIGTITSRS